MSTQGQADAMTSTDSNTRSPATLFYREPRLIALVALMLIAAGASAFLALGRQEDPTITNLFARVTTVFPGADPARVESLITDPIEAELQGIGAIETLVSSSEESISIIQIDLDEQLDDSGIDDAWADIRAALDRVRPSLPLNALAPEFEESSSGAWSTISAIVPDSSMTLATAARYAEVLADDLRRVSGTDEVKLYGLPDEEILVEIDIERLAAMSLRTVDVSDAIRAADAKVRAGSLRGTGRDLLIEVTGELDTVERIRSIPLQGSDARIARIGDVARVTKGVKEPASEAALASGQHAILVASRLSSGLQVDVWMGDVRTVQEQFMQQLPAGIEHGVVFDQSRYTVDRLTSVGTNMAIGVALVVIVLLVTMGVRSALIVALVLPLVSLAAIATMNLIGLPLHQMSITGLIVALGLLVDAAIVMSDEIGKRLRAGMARADAVGDAVRRLWAPLLASTITTVLSFLPLALLPGGAGDFVGAIAIAVIIMLCWSFAIAMTITAALAGRLLPAPKTLASGDAVASTPEPRAPGERLAAVIASRFRRLMALAIRYPTAAIMLSLVLPLTGFLSLPSLVQQFFPGVERDQFHLEIELDEGSTLTRTDSVASALDDIIRAEDGIEEVTWVIGKSAPSFYYNMVGDRDRAPNYAQALVRTTSPKATTRLVPHLQSDLAQRFPDARIIVRGLVQGPPVSAPVELRLTGPDLDTLTRLGERYRTILSGLDSITVARASLEAGAPKLVVDVDEVAARLAGLGLVDVATSLDSALEGAVSGSVIEGGKSLPVRVRVGNEQRAELERVLELPVLPRTTPGNTPSAPAFDAIPLSAVTRVSLEPSASGISRRNGERVNTVQGFIPSGMLPAVALDDVRAALDTANIVLPAGYRLEFGGDSDARDNTVNDLLASLGIIVTLSIAALVLSLGSFRLSVVALLVALLSAGLSFLALAVFRYPFGINALIGIIGSIGVSINASLIILSGLKADEDAASGDVDAMVEVVVGSGRHIVSTTLTTFGGFLPLILGGGAFWPPFAMAIAGGVLLSAVVSFGFVPAMFRLLYSRGGNAINASSGPRKEQFDAPITQSASSKAAFATVPLIALFLMLAPIEAQAEGPDGGDRPPAFLVLGAGALPEYEGADATAAVPLVVARAHVGNAQLEVAGTQARLGIVRAGNLLAGPVLGFTGPRDEDVDDPQVARLEPVDLSLEPGAFVGWRGALGELDEGTLEMAATVTTAAGGDWEGTELTAGADYSWAATPIWRLALGASVSAVDGTYADSRFGISARDAAASGLAPFDPSGGLKDASVSVRSILSFSPRYGVFSRIAYTRLLGDAADSPLVAETGSADQGFVGVGLFVSFGR